MKKIYFAIGVIILLLSSCGQRKELNELQVRNLKGDVISVATRTYKAKNKFGEITKDEVAYSNIYDELNSLIEFNNFKQLISISAFDKRGDLEGKRIYTYKDDNLYCIDSYDENGELKNKTIYTYEKEFVSSIIMYDNDGDKIQTNTYENNGSRLTKLSFFDKEGELISSTIFQGDNNRISKQISTDKSGNETIIINEFVGDFISKIIHPEYTIEVIRNKNNDVIEAINAEISPNQNIIFSEGSNIIYEYEYDEKGNWIKRFEIDKSTKEARYISERIIEYK